MLQKPTLFLKPPGVACEAARGAKNPVAGNDDGDGIAAHSAAYGLSGHACGYFQSQASVASGFTPGDIQQQLPDLTLKRCAGRGEGKAAGLRGRTPEIIIQPVPNPGEQGKLRLVYPRLPHEKGVSRLQSGKVLPL